jgi:hypothetical protein
MGARAVGEVDSLLTRIDEGQAVPIGIGQFQRQPQSQSHPLHVRVASLLVRDATCKGQTTTFSNLVGASLDAEISLAPTGFHRHDEHAERNPVSR